MNVKAGGTAPEAIAGVPAERPAVYLETIDREKVSIAVTPREDATGPGPVIDVSRGNAEQKWPVILQCRIQEGDIVNIPGRSVNQRPITSGVLDENIFEGDGTSAWMNPDRAVIRQCGAVCEFAE